MNAKEDGNAPLWSTLVLAVTLFLRLAADAVASPTVTVTAEPRQEFRYIVFTFRQSDIPSMDGCFYNFMASGSKRNVERQNISALSIATFYKPLSEIRIIAGPLGRLSKGATKSTNQGTVRRPPANGSTIYFRTLITCYNGAIFPAETLSLDVGSTPRGKVASLNRLIKKMKYHMAYYDGE